MPSFQIHRELEGDMTGIVIVRRNLTNQSLGRYNGNRKTMIEIITHNHASELISRSGTYLERHESENNLPIGLVYRLSESPHYYGSKSPLLLSILEQEKVVGVAIMTPPRRIILSRIDTEVRVAISHLVQHLRGTHTRTPGVVGPSVEAQAFSDCWVEGAFGVSARVTMRLRVFEARKVTDISLSPGKLRLARMDDHPLMAKWIAKFSEEIREPVDLDNAKSHAERSIKGTGTVHLGQRCASLYR